MSHVYTLTVRIFKGLGVKLLKKIKDIKDRWFILSVLTNCYFINVIKYALLI